MFHEFYALKFYAAQWGFAAMASAQSFKFYALKFRAVKFSTVSDSRAVWEPLRQNSTLRHSGRGGMSVVLNPSR
ncbi:hypothetical protein [uncultured Campylobacter sp.]|uniref:hypothetical protein n=1 Tax=uncultured Campylobacter sp. TaxID=218934 RepID=UPI002612F960|nr:hypothetical protein [uncultured Campylobacter sp.]